jgi:hypothetical protein
MIRFSTSVIVVGLMLCETVFACTVVIEGTRKIYRRSSQVFVGKFIEFEENSNAIVPDNLKAKWKTIGEARFSIAKSWKGQRTGSMSLYVNPVCDCPMREMILVPGEEVLIFADKDGVVDSCDIQYVLRLQNERDRIAAKDVTKRLDSFWFRTWAGIYPF